MGRKPPLNLDIDEGAMLAEMFGGDFVKLAKEKKEKKEIDKTNTIPETKEKPEKTTQKDKSDSKIVLSDFVERLITTHSQWDNCKRILIDKNLNHELKRISILFKIAYPDKDKYLTVRNLINNILYEYIFSQKEIKEELTNLIKNRPIDK